MILKKLADSLFNKDSKSEKTSSLDISLIERIVSTMETLNLKSTNLNDSFSEEKTKIAQINDLVKSFVMVDEIQAAKLEQEILGKITVLSFACDSVLAGGEANQVKQALSALNINIQQRLDLQSK